MLRFDALKRAKILVISAGEYFSYFPIFPVKKTAKIIACSVREFNQFKVPNQSINKDYAGFTEAGLNSVNLTREYSMSVKGMSVALQ